MASTLKVNTITDKSGTGSPSFPNKLNYADFPAGTVIQTAYAESNTSSTGTTVIPADDTIPQITEGNLILSCSITPRFSNSKLLVIGRLNGVENSTVSTSLIICALFRNDQTNAIVAEAQQNLIGNIIGTTNIEGGTFTLLRQIDASTTSTLTFSMRAGLGGAGSTEPFRWNGGQGLRFLGGSQYSSITIQEIKQ